MNNPFRYLLAFAILAVSGSCINEISAKKLGVFNKVATPRYITNGDKQIVFIGMHHIGKKEFYQDVKRICDSLYSNDYSIFFEGLNKVSYTDSLRRDSVYKKIRQLTGIHLLAMKKNGGYIDTVNNTLMGKKIKFISKYDLINQPRALLPLRDSVRVRNIDASLETALMETERIYGPVILTPYDHNTLPGEEYKYKKKELKTPRSQYYLLGYRNKLIADSVLKGPDKIVLIYGAKHFEGIFENLKASDPKYQQVLNFK